MIEANNDNWSREGENADFSMEDFWLPFVVADDGAGAVVDEVLETAPREGFLTLIFAACGLLWCAPHMIRPTRRMEADKIQLQNILGHIFFDCSAVCRSASIPTIYSCEILGSGKKFEWMAAHEQATYPQTL
jgi:hypothetical protein